MKEHSQETGMNDNAVRSQHATIVGPLAAAMSAQARCPVQIELAAVDRPRYEKFVAGLQLPSCLHLIRANPLNECLLVEITPSILFPLIDRMLGGGGDDFAPPQRALSDIELPLAARLTRVFLQQLCPAWASIADLELELVRAESNPRLLRALPADEPMVTVEFHLSFGARRGSLRLAYPQRTYDRLHEAAARGGAAQQANAAHPSPDALVDVSVALQPVIIAAGELSALSAGDLIVTDSQADSPVVISLAGHPKYLGRLGVCGGRKAVLVGDPMPTS